jgi:hypothetical protein
MSPLDPPATGDHPREDLLNRFLALCSALTLAIVPAACGGDGSGSSGQLLRCVSSSTGLACEPVDADSGETPPGTCVDVDDDDDGSPDDDDDDDRDGDGLGCDDDDDDDDDGVSDDDDDDDDDDDVLDDDDCDDEHCDDESDDTCDDEGDDTACPV